MQQQQQQQQQHLISSNQPSADCWSGCKQQIFDQQQQLQKEKQLHSDNQLQFMSCKESCSSPLARTHQRQHSPTNTSVPATSSSSVCTVPVRDAASLKAIRYGPGHEKYPSWPGEGTHKGDSGGANGGPHPARSKSWTDHTNYPKERQQPLAKPKPQPFTQQLKTVMERCEKLPADMFETGGTNRQPAPLPPQGGDHPPFPLPRLDRDGKVLGEDRDYSVPSPPERDLSQLTRADLEEYARVYHHEEESADYAQIPTESHLTRAELEQYTRAYEDSNSLRPSHQTQASYAQSEGYHSYVSSTDSTTTTPFLDRLRRDSEAVALTRCTASSVNNDTCGGHESSASSGSSSETLKWHGSLSDVSSVSSSSAHAGGAPHVSSSAAHAIAHSSRVAQPQRHHSESVLYLSGGGGGGGGGGLGGAGGPPAWVQRNNQINNQMRRLFPVSTYTVQPNEDVQTRSPATLSVAERINELERQQRLSTSLKEQRCSDHAALKAFQKKALLSFYERHHSAWKSEPQLMANTTMSPQAPPPLGGGGPPLPPLRPKGPAGAGAAAPQQQQQQPSRRSSSASDYAGAAWREMVGANKETRLDSTGQREIRHQHSSSCGSLSTAVLGPIIVGPSISVDDWVPARPPKKPHLRAAYGGAPPNPPSPDLPPPSPPPVDEEAEVFISDEPLPPPPPEVEWLSKPNQQQKQNHNLLPHQTTRSQFDTSTSPQQNHKHLPTGLVDSRRSNTNPSEVTLDSKGTHITQDVVRNDTSRYSNSSSQIVDPGRTSLNSSYVDKSKPNLSQEVSRNEYGKHSPQIMNSGNGLLNSSYADKNKSNLGQDSSRNEFSSSQGRHKNIPQIVNSERSVFNTSYVESTRPNVHSKSPPFDKSKSNISQESSRNEYGKHNSSSQMLNLERMSLNSSYFDSSKANVSQESSRNDLSKHSSSSHLVHSERVAAMSSISTSNKRSPSTYYENQIDMLRQSLQQSLPVMAEPQTRLDNEVDRQENCNHRLENHDHCLDNQSLDNQNHHVDSRNARLDNPPHLNACLDNQNHQEAPRKNSQHDLHHAQIYNQNSYSSVVSSGSGKERLRNKADVINGVESRLKDCSKVGEGVGDSKLTEGLVPVVQKTTWKAYSDQYQPRSLDSNLSVDSRYETQNSKPGPQAPVDKGGGGGQKSPQKVGSDFNALKARIQNEVTSKSTTSFRKNSFSGRKNSGGEEEQQQQQQHQSSGFASIKNVFQQCSERNSFRISTTAQKLLVDGKIANAVQKGTISPTHRYAPGSGQLTPGSAHFTPASGQFTPGTAQVTPGSAAAHFTPGSAAQFQRASIRRSKIEHVPAATVHSSQLQYARNHVEPMKAAGEERRLPPALPPQCPPTSHQRSQSKASAYLAYRREPRERERGLPNFTGSYKRTMSPSGGQIKSINNIENQDTIKDKPPVPLTPTALDNQPLDNNHLNNNNSVNNNNHHLEITDKKPVLPNVETKTSPSQEQQQQQQQQRIANCQTSIVNIVNSNSGSNDIICDNTSSVRVETSSTSSLSSLSSSSSSTTRTTLPRNYSLPDQQQKRPILRTARTQSDPVNAVAVAVLPQDSKGDVKVIRSSSSSASVNSDNSISIAINQSSSMEGRLKREESFQKVITVSPLLSGPEDHSQDGCSDLKREESFQKVITVSRVSSPTVSVATSTSPDPDDNNQVTISSSEVSIAIGGDAAEKTAAANEPLRLLQRTEVTLRVNAATTDAASQTELSAQARTPSPSTAAAQQASSLLRLPLREEIECDQLSRDLATRLPPTHRLQGILAPGPEVKKCTDYVSGLFRLDLLPRSRTSLASSTATTTETSNCETALDTNAKVKEPGGVEEAVESAAQNLSANSAYFTTSECKARLLALCNNHTQSETATSSIGPNDNLYQKKEELMSRLSRKLVVLREEAVAVVEETSLNESLGETVHARASAQGARPHELAKLRLHIKEVGHITQLLLGLSGRLARAENALLGMDPAHCERKILEEKRDKLRAQLEEAKQLKVSIDRRSGSVSTMLYKYLTTDEYADYDHFIGMKAKLLIDSREIDDKIKLGEEQLAALKEMLNETTTAR